MTPERFQRIAELFEHVRALPAEARDEALAEGCGDDAEVRAAVAELLDLHRDDDPFLASAPPAPEPDPMPERIGPYAVEREIGEGGMGRVYLGRQDEPIKRRVAIKLIKLGMDSDDLVDRFNAERQVLALMDHPNIARIFDAGVTERGRPWFGMEYVDGQPLLAYCDERRLSLRDRLRLFVEICRTVQHAHQKGVIHRDLKPSNVLIEERDGRPAPKLIDFGIAKAAAGSGADRTLTADGRVIGTPAYMSPEQATSPTNAIDTRTDVYSLGVMLYELTAGVTPLDQDRIRSASLSEIQRWIADENPPRLSVRAGDVDAALAARRGLSPEALARALAGDIDVITETALAREPADRYHSAAALADDLERHLENRPLLAAPPSPRARLVKFARRNRRTLIALGLATVAVVASIGVARLGTTRALAAETDAKRDLDLARDAERAEALQRDEALRNTKKADLVLTLVRTMFQAADPTMFKGRDYTVAQLLADFGDKHWSRLTDQPEVEATLRMTFAMSYEGLGDFDESEEHFARALHLLTTRYGPDHPDTAFAKLSLGWTLQFKNDIRRAAPLIEEALGALERAHPDGHRHVGFALTNLATIRRHQARFREAIDLYERALRLFERIEGRADTRSAPLPDPDRVNRAHVLQGLGFVLFQVDEHARAAGALQATLDLLPGPKHPSYITTLIQLGDVERARGNAAAGNGHLRRAAALAREHSGGDSREFAEALTALAAAKVRDKDFNAAASRLTRALKALRPDTPAYYRAIENLAEIDIEFGRYTKAIERLAAPTATLEQRGDQPYALANFNTKLAIACMKLRRFDESRRRFEAALAFITPAFGPTDRRALNIRGNMAVMHGERGDFKEAARIGEELVRDQTDANGNLSLEGLADLHNLASFYVRLGDPRALEAKRRAYETRKKLLGLNHLDTVRSAINYAFSLRRKRRRKEAVQVLAPVVAAIDERAERHPSYRAALNGYGRALYAAGKRTEARAMLARYARAEERAVGLDRESTLLAWLTIATTDHQAGRDAAALAITERLAKALAPLPAAHAPQARATLLPLLGSLYLNADKIPAAITHLERALVAGRAARWSPLQRAMCRNALGAAYGREAGRDDEATKLLTESFTRLLAMKRTPSRVLALARKRTVAFFESRSDTERAARWRDAKSALEKEKAKERAKAKRKEAK